MQIYGLGVGTVIRFSCLLSIMEMLHGRLAPRSSMHFVARWDCPDFLVVCFDWLTYIGQPNDIEQ